MRVRLIAILLGMSGVAAAEPESVRLLPTGAQHDRDARLQEDEARVRREHEVFLERGNDQTRNAALVDLEKDAFEKYREKRMERRHTGYLLLGVGAGFGLAAGVAGYLGYYDNQQIQSGTLATKGDIQGYADAGQIENVVAWSCVAVGAAFVVLGTTDVVLNLDPGEFVVTPIATGNSAGVGFAGRF
jgi:hypothetical protein